MLRTDKPIYKVILVLNLLLIVVGATVSLMDINGTNTLGLVYTVLDVLALLFALFYILYGYTKNAAGYYKTFGYLYLASRLICAFKTFSGPINITANNSKLFNSVSICIIIALLLVLVFAKNLGKKKSLILCGVIVAFEAILFIIIYNEIGAFNLGAKLKLADLDLACLYGILTYAKYLDKTERGAK